MVEEMCVCVCGNCAFWPCVGVLDSLLCRAAALLDLSPAHITNQILVSAVPVNRIC